MKKLNKTCNLSTKYKDWLKELKKDKKNHPEYKASFKYYWDVVMNLFYCQDGLCAYTEKRLCPKHNYATNKWKNGRYTRSNYYPKKPKIKGELEHFDPNLKSDQGWQWDNLFMADSDLNSKVKGVMEIDPMLKPDGKKYDPFALFEYDFSKNIFKAKITLPKAHQDVINKFCDDILNFDPVIDDRRIFLAPRVKSIELGIEDWHTTEIEEFPTSFEMIKRQRTSTTAT